MKIRIGTRTSELATLQAETIADLLNRAHADVETELVGMSTRGDEMKEADLPDIGGKGLFTARLEHALREDDIDLAVHSLKDLPTTLPDGLVYAGSPERVTPTDAFVSHRHDSIDDVPEEGVVATGSRRRRAQLLQRKPDLEFRNLRGNIGTRLQKLADSTWDGIVMATAALERLDHGDAITSELDPTLHVPAVSQGALGVEIAERRTDIGKRLEAIRHQPTVTACRAERTFLRILEGGCTVPVGGFCRRESDEWAVYGWVGDTAGRSVLRDRRSGPDPEPLAAEMARDFLDRGAKELMNRGI